MVFDSHVHIGQFRDTYYSPARVLRYLQKSGITQFAYSSTSTIATIDMGFLNEEISAMHSLSNGMGVPLQWITRAMMQKPGNLDAYLSPNIKGLKIHGASEKWDPYGKPLKRVFSLAAERNIPILIHTGEDKGVMAGEFIQICKAYPSVKVILAHGRPLAQTESMLSSCANVYVDTAFMPHKDLQHLVELGFSAKILFGTDTPIPLEFYSSSLTRYIKRRIASTIRVATPANADAILFKNAQTVFNI